MYCSRQNFVWIGDIESADLETDGQLDDGVQDVVSSSLLRRSCDIVWILPDCPKTLEVDGDGSLGTLPWHCGAGAVDLERIRQACNDKSAAVGCSSFIRETDSDFHGCLERSHITVRGLCSFEELGQRRRQHKTQH